MPRPALPLQSALEILQECNWASINEIEDLSHLLEEPANQSTHELIVRCPGRDLKCHWRALIEARHTGFATPSEMALPTSRLALTILDDLDTPMIPVAECAICLETIEHPVVTPCNHVFHRECIDQTVELQHECPLGRRRIDEVESCVTSKSAQPAAPQLGFECDVRAEVMENTLRVIYRSSYECGMGNCRHKGHLEKELDILSPDRWREHLDVYLAAARLDLDFAQMQRQSLQCFNLMAHMLAGDGDWIVECSAKVGKNARVDENVRMLMQAEITLQAQREACLMLEAICKLQLEGEARKEIYAQMQSVWAAFEPWPKMYQRLGMTVSLGVLPDWPRFLSSQENE